MKPVYQINSIYMIKHSALLLLLLCASPCCFSQNTGCFTETADHNIELDSWVDFSQYNGFFIGEAHFDGRQDMKLAMLQYLNRQYGITDVFMELGYNAAFLYNRYLATGDATYIDLRYNQWYKTEEDKQFWRKLYEYNMTLQEKIVIRGMDYENSHFFKTLYYLMPAGKEKPKKISKTLSHIERKGPRKHLIRYPKYNKIKREIYKNIDLYREYYGDSFGLVSDVMFTPANIDASVAYAKRTSHIHRHGTIIYRDSAMCYNVRKQIKQDSIKKFIVFVGAMHSNKARRNSLYTNMVNSSGTGGQYANFALAFKNTDPDAKYRNKYRYLIAMDENDKEITYDTNFAILEAIYEKYFNHDCRYTMISTKDIADGTTDTDLKKYTDYLIMMEGKW